MLVKRDFLRLALLLALATGTLAQQKPASYPAPSLERLRAHVAYLASDKLEGRRTGTEGANAAARYIAEEFARHNLRPGGSNSHALATASGASRYMQQFPFVAGIELGKNNSMLFTPRAASLQPSGEATATAASTRAAALDLRLGEDWMPLGFSASANIAGAPVTFVGYGIRATELRHDDYAGVDVKGRIVVALAGTPEGDNPHGRFSRYADVRWKAIAAREQGAAALVVIARAENFREERLARLNYDNSTGDVALPAVVISRAAAARILGLNSPTQLAALEKDVDKWSAARGSTEIRGYIVTVGVKFDLLDGVALSIQTDIARQQTPGTNVIGILEGSDSQLKNEAIIIGAHYDHLGRGGAGSLAPREGEVHHGADDNASGVAGLLELSRIFSEKGMRPRRTIIFIAFGGEEEGLLGSNYYVNHPIVPLAQTIAMINMDMIGRQKENQLMIGGTGTAAEWRDLINAANQAMFKTESPQTGGAIDSAKIQRFSLTLNEDGYGPSDHSSFYAKQVPVLFFFTGTHEDYHKPSDTADKINYESEARIVSLVAAIVRSIDTSDKRPTYTVAKSESTRNVAMSFRVTLGVVPNYAEAGDGMKIDGVRDDSPAAKAGLLAGDRITKLAGREVRNVYDYTYALGEMKAGEEYEIEVVRESQTLKLKITPTARK
ncbi:MAG TPA: M20/M25/M40 family metallo-hydrolase [Pyrinomonadaceae bacterium]